MSRKHAPPLDADWLTVAKAISWSLHRARQNGATPVAIVMDPVRAHGCFHGAYRNRCSTKAPTMTLKTHPRRGAM